MSNYILELRKIVGQRPLIQCGTCVMIRNENKILMQLRTDNKKMGITWRINRNRKKTALCISSWRRSI